MDWHAAIDKNREALKRVLAVLVGMAGGAVFTSRLRGGRAEGAGGGDLTEPSSTPTRQSDDYLGRAACRARPSDPHKGEVERPTLHRHLHRAILRLLRPAEAAARRLVIVAALKEPAKTLPPILRTTASQARITGAAGTPPILPRSRGRENAEGGGEGMSRPPRLAFRLLDPLPRWRPERRPVQSGIPRVCVPGVMPRLPAPIRRPLLPGDEISAVRLSLRLAALSRVLDDLPGHARRFVRWQARRDAVVASERERRSADAAANRTRRGQPRLRLWPLRPGRPPGLPRRPAYEVHHILDVLHGLAFWVLEGADTS